MPITPTLDPVLLARVSAWKAGDDGDPGFDVSGAADLLRDVAAALFPEADDDDLTDQQQHELDHAHERAGGERVDRRVCQGIGCPYGGR